MLFYMAHAENLTKKCFKLNKKIMDCFFI